MEHDLVVTINPDPSETVEFADQLFMVAAIQCFLWNPTYLERKTARQANNEQQQQRLIKHVFVPDAVLQNLSCTHFLPTSAFTSLFASTSMDDKQHVYSTKFDAAELWSWLNLLNQRSTVLNQGSTSVKFVHYIVSHRWTLRTVEPSTLGLWNHRELLREIIKLPPHANFELIQAFYRLFPSRTTRPVIGLHVQRSLPGKENSRFDHDLSSLYYHRALRQAIEIESKRLNNDGCDFILVSSEQDREWVMCNFKNLDLPNANRPNKVENHHFIMEDGSKQALGLFLLTLCSYVVVSNSSVGWWSGFLCPHTVMCPDIWFGSLLRLPVALATQPPWVWNRLVASSWTLVSDHPLDATATRQNGRQLAKYWNPVLVETGSHQGGGIDEALGCGYPTIISIEMAPYWYQFCQKLFRKYRHRVTLVHGSSACDHAFGQLILQQRLNADVPVTFLLDARYIKGKTAFDSKYICPLKRELELIAKYRHHGHERDVVLIKGRRYFTASQDAGIDGNTDLTEAQVSELLFKINPYFNVQRDDDDLLVATATWFRPTLALMAPPSAVVTKEPMRTLNLKQVKTVIISPNQGKYAARYQRTLNMLTKQEKFEKVQWQKTELTPKSQVGGTMGFLQAFRRHLDECGNVFEPLLIVEDDVSPSSSNLTYEVTIPSEADMLYIGISLCGAQPLKEEFCWTLLYHPVASEESMVQVFNMLGTHAMLFLKAETLQELIRRFELQVQTHPDGHWDMRMARYQSQHTVYALRRPLFYQDAQWGGQEQPTRAVLDAPEGTLNAEQLTLWRQHKKIRWFV